MKRPNSTDSLTGDSKNGGFMEDDEEYELSSQVGAGGSGLMGEKKRRLSVEQVRALEKNFEVENKLEPDRKVKLAMELGLQPRQVAVWFQNRRARWKTKQLERDYTSLKSTYDSLKISYEALRSDKDALLAEVNELKLKLGLVKEEQALLPLPPEELHKGVVEKQSDADELEGPPELVCKDGSSDSDSSAILNDDNSPGRFAISSQGYEEEETKAFFMGFHHCQEDKNGRFGLSYYHQQHLRPEDQHVSLLDGIEPCADGFFPDDPPAMPWYCTEQWS